MRTVRQILFTSKITMQNNIKKDTQLMTILDLKEVSRILCNTDKSYLTLKLRKGETQYWLYLDSVPLSKSDNKEVMDLLFPPKIEVQQVNRTVGMKEAISYTEAKGSDDIGGGGIYTGKGITPIKGLEKIVDDSTTVVYVKELPKKKGRPAGSKNK